MTHKLKCWPNYFDDLMSGKKTFEVRVNDRDFKVGDVLELQEFSPTRSCYLSRKLTLRVNYILRGSKSNLCINDGACVMAIELVPPLG